MQEKTGKIHIFLTFINTLTANYITFPNMTDLFKILIIFLTIGLMLRKKIKVGYVLTISAFILSILYKVRPKLVIAGISNSLISKTAIELIIALTFIRIFEKILREKKILANMMESVKVILKNKKIVTVSMPLLIGMIPSVGGAYFSAPMVDEATRDLELPSENKAFLNYWYRHPWEFILPLYPGIILASALTGIRIKSFISMNAMCGISMLFIGFFLSMRKIKGHFEIDKKKNNNSLKSFLPLLVLLLSVIALNIKLHYALVINVTGLIIYFRFKASEIKDLINYGFSKDIPFLIFGVLLFKNILTTSGAALNLTNIFTVNNIPILALIFTLPFICGLLTGITIGYVGIVFPILVEIPNISPYAMSFAFVSGFAGVLLSPVHVCLVLTREYFDSSMFKIYRIMTPGVAVIMIIALIQYWVFI